MVPTIIALDNQKLSTFLLLLHENMFLWRNTVFDLITAHTPTSAQSGNSTVFRLQPVNLLKVNVVGYPFELHRLVDAIQMGTHNICFYKKNHKEKTTQNIMQTSLFKYTENFTTKKMKIFK